MIRLDLCTKIGLRIFPTPHSATQADGESRLNVVGEVHTTMRAENNVEFKLDAIVVHNLKVEVIVSEAFLEENCVVVDIPRRRLIMPDERCVRFSDQPGNPKLALLRADVNHVIFPGDLIRLSTPNCFLEDGEVVLEPRLESPLLYDPSIVKNEGKLDLVNNSEFAIRIRKGQIVGQIRSVCEEQTFNHTEVDICEASTKPLKQMEKPTEIVSNVSIDPQDCFLTSEEVREFREINVKYNKAFGPKRGLYNSKSGDIKAAVHVGTTTPVPKKGKIPSYKRKNLEILQEKFDELHEEGALVRPEDYGIKVVHTSPSFLVKKSDDSSYRMVTSFTELNKFIRLLPSRMSTTSDVLRSVSRWKYIIKTDLKNAYYQIKIDKESMQWLGTNSPYKGMFVYATAAMGLRNMAEYLEEVVSRVFGDMISEGVVDKVADDLLIGGDNIEELLRVWTRVLQRLLENGLTISASKTIICPRKVKILGWLWENGTISVDVHKTNPLTVCSLPETVKQLRSFIGAFRAVSICIQNYGNHLCRLEDLVAGKESCDKLTWNDELVKAFKSAQKALMNPKTITLPHPNDQLILISDGCNSLPAVGATLFVKRNDNLRIGGYFSAKIHKYQIPWLPCEIEALGINLAINSFAHVIRESKHTTKFLTDSKPCVQAYEKLSKGGFSLSPRISSFLMNLNAHNVAIEHVKGSSIKMTDFSSRNPVLCTDSSCQVCQFINEKVDLAVAAVSFEDVENGTVKMPFYNTPAWKQAQRSDPDLKRCYAQLKEGTRPGKKERNLRLLRRYFQIASISDSGLLVYRKSNPYGPDFNLIIVPKDLAKGLISALHLQLKHPTKTQFRKLWNRFFFALDGEKLIDECTVSCPLCRSLQKLPKELFEQKTHDIPLTVGKVFSADIIRRERQKILVMQDIFSSFLLAQIVLDEYSSTLQQMLVQLSATYKHPDGCSIRVDAAPGFKALCDDKYLLSVGISLDFGRVKSKNQNPCIDKAIQDLEREIKRLAPNAGPISAGTLAMAVCNTNNRIRMSGLSAKEIVTKRDGYSGDPLQFEDKDISRLRYEKRLQNHQSSERSKSSGGKIAQSIEVSPGDIVHIKNEGTKHRAREFYLVMSVDRHSSKASIQKFCGSTLRSKRYEVKLNEIYLASPIYLPSSIQSEYRCDELYEDDGVDLRIETDFRNDSDAEQELELTIPVRRSARIRREPDRLATSEIQSCNK